MREISTGFQWKTFAVTILFFFMVVLAVAQPQVCVITNQGSSGKECSGQSLGEIEYCTVIPFVVENTNIPSGYATVGKYEWYVNDVLVKTSTTHNDYGLNYALKDEEAKVYCYLTYKKSNGDLSAPVKSTEFNVWTKIMNLVINGPNSVSMGDLTPLAYNIANGGSCLGCYSPPGTTYSVSWTPIPNWTQTGMANNGRNVTFTPDAYTGGTLIATVTMNSCPYQKALTYGVSRPTPPISFAAGNTNLVCGSSQNFSVDPVQGASSYTYTMIGTGTSFTANGQQAITAGTNTIGVSFSGITSGNFTLKAKANFGGSTSTAEASHYFKYGPPDEWVEIVPVPETRPWDCYTQYNSYTFTANIADPATGLAWSYFEPNSGFRIPNNSSTFYFMQAGGYGIVVEPYNACGTGDYAYTELGINVYAYSQPWCTGYRMAKTGDSSKVKSANKSITLLNRQLVTKGGFRVFPNPANSSITVSSPRKAITMIKVYDMQGRLQKHLVLNKVATTALSVSDLPVGVYIIAVGDGNIIERAKINVQR